VLHSLKFFLSLYGHKLPVLAMDISSDSSLLVTGSADKNIKVGVLGRRQGDRSRAEEGGEQGREGLCDPGEGGGGWEQGKE
jgi:hypothetical protein